MSVTLCQYTIGGLCCVCASSCIIAPIQCATTCFVGNGSGLTNLPSSTVYTYQNSNYNANIGDNIVADTSSGSFTVTLPASPSFGSKVTFVDDKYTFNTNNLIVAYSSGQTIMGFAQNLYVNINGASFGLLYSNNSNWIIV